MELAMSFGSITSEKVTETDFKDPTFAYIIKVQIGQKICFGSTKERNTAPIGKGLSPFQRRKAPEWFKQGPGSYNVEKYTSALYPILNKVRSNRGVGPLASNDKRFKHKHVKLPSPSRYNVIPKRDTKQAKAPFGVKAISKRPDNNNPGPATYDIRKIKKCRRTRFMNNFGKPSMIYAIETTCVPVPVDTCQKCNQLCKGDYWHREYSFFLCHLCWVEEKQSPELYNKEELKQFKKIRNCSFMHNHEGTEAALLILPPNKIKKKLYLENYLELYIDC